MQTTEHPAAPLRLDADALSAWRDRRQTFARADAASRKSALDRSARHLRQQVLHTIHAAGLGHVGGDLSVADILTTLFEGVMTLDPQRPDWEERDRFILSKGHCAAALYGTLAACGFFSAERLAHFAADLSPLNGHPNRNKIPGVETNTGPLGHGLPVGVGCATAAQMAGQAWRTYVVLGDGELQEGSNWEAAMYAAHRKLDNLVAIVDRNRLQQGLPTEETNTLEPLADKWRAFGWQVHEVDGHDTAALYEAFTTPHPGQPRAVIAHTVKGKGVSFMENGVEWHHKVPSDAQYQAALAELGEA
ncbi:transketolase [Pseudaquabacterium rugosum]|uniref:Transketolase n=1 Tax=Pseudaquabacterium rugosum TaxID=2984194 RepID=A0ABU9BEA9_9BURK